MIFWCSPILGGSITPCALLKFREVHETFHQLGDFHHVCDARCDSTRTRRRAMSKDLGKPIKYVFIGIAEMRNELLRLLFIPFSLLLGYDIRPVVC
jgi:hypothetical protein